MEVQQEVDFLRRIKNSVKSFFTSDDKSKNFKEKLIFQVKEIEEWEKKRDYLFYFYSRSYHWWLFPIDKPSYLYGDEYQLDKTSIEILKADKEYMESYLKGLNICFRLWGWMLKENIIDEKSYNSECIDKYYRALNLLKAINSTDIFGFTKERESLIKFASYIVKDPVIKAIKEESFHELRAIVESVELFESNSRILSQHEALEAKVLETKQSIKKYHSRLISWLSKEKYEKFYEYYLDPWLFPSDTPCPIHGDAYKLDKEVMEKLRIEKEFKEIIGEGLVLALQFWGWKKNAKEIWLPGPGNQYLIRRNLTKTQNSVKRAIYCFDKLFPETLQKEQLEALVHFSQNLLCKTSEEGLKGNSGSPIDVSRKMEIEIEKFKQSDATEGPNKQAVPETLEKIFSFQKNHLADLKKIHYPSKLDEYLSSDTNNWLRSKPLSSDLEISVMGCEDIMDETQMSVLKKNSEYKDLLKQTIHAVAELLEWSIPKQTFLYQSYIPILGSNTTIYLYCACKSTYNLDLRDEFKSLVLLCYKLLENNTSNLFNQNPSLRKYFIEQHDQVRKELKLNNQSLAFSQKLISIKQRNIEQSKLFIIWRQTNSWSQFHSSHFDWWAFPIDETSSSYGSEFTVSKEDIEILKKDAKFMESLKICLESVSLSWGWNLDEQDFLKRRDYHQSWYSWGVRLYKATKSAGLFDLQKEHKSLVLLGISILRQGHTISYAKTEYSPYFLQCAKDLKIID